MIGGCLPCTQERRPCRRGRPRMGHAGMRPSGRSRYGRGSQGEDTVANAWRLVVACAMSCDVMGGMLLPYERRV